VLIFEQFLVEIIQVHIQTSNGLPLELVSHCVVVPPDIHQEHSSDVFADATEEEAVRYRCVFDSRLNIIGHHITSDLQCTLLNLVDK
jgi:hypothetical protein